MNYSFKRRAHVNQRVQAIADAAARLFIQQGYARTQISHIAKAVGVSVGTIYLDFAGKKEILHYILKCTADPLFIDCELERPIGDGPFTGLEDELPALFESAARSFAAPLNDISGYSFESLISDTFDMLSRYAVGCLFIEKNRFDFPQLAQCYTAYRGQFFETMTAYLRAFIGQGTLRPLEHPELTAALIIETLSWWAMDRRYATFQPNDISQDLAKQVCMDNLVAAYKR